MICYVGLMLTKEIQLDTHGGPVTLHPRWLRIPAAVKYSGLSRSRLYELLSQGRIRSICLKSQKSAQRGVRLIDRESIDLFMERQEFARRPPSHRGLQGPFRIFSGSICAVMESMNRTSQSIIQPRYVALDTSTWIDLIKHRNDPEAKDILTVLNSGQIIPYVSFEHVLELVQQSDQNVRLEQLDFFREIKLVGFPKPISFPASWRNSPLCGSYQDVEEPEISVLLKNPSLTLEQVIEQVRPDAIAGLASGKDFANDAVLRDIAGTGRVTGFVQLNRAAASMVHVSPPNPNDVIPQAGDYTMLDPQAAEQLKPQLIAALAQQFRLSGEIHRYRILTG
jgi:hypothetical protein